MRDRQRSLRLGIAVILSALALRLWAAAQLPRLVLQLNSPALAIYTETGQNVRFLSSSGVFSYDFPSESPFPAEPAKPYYGEDPLPMLQNTSAQSCDPQALLARELPWDLRRGAVLILSTHATESYTKQPGEVYEESAGWRTLDEGYNMLSIGDLLEQLLTRAGIRVLRDRQLHDWPSYNGSYAHARTSLEKELQEHPEILLVLDLHRDAADGPGGSQLRTLAGEGCAQLMVVLGTASGHWQENLSLGLKLCAQLERQHPGITRPIQLRRASFNQDLCPGALLIEVGAAGNSRGEALEAARELAGAIIALSRGTANNSPDSY